ncbi:MAG: ThuA domain-containing protein [Planctomycetes bacterium]|nr:ThuA domain-containing protein [Planctomycetota bacterium]
MRAPPFVLAIACAIAPALAVSEEALRPREIAPGVRLLSFSDRYGSANAGWIDLQDRVVLVGAPHPEVLDRLLGEAQRTAGKPVRQAIFTHGRAGEKEAALALAEKGIAVLAPAEVTWRWREGIPSSRAERIQELPERLKIADASREVEVISFGHAAGIGDAAVFLPKDQVLFAGELCVHGPRAALAGSNTARWARALESLQKLPAQRVVPGFGSEGGPELLERQKSFLLELRRQTGHGIAMGLPLKEVRGRVRLEPQWLVWMPYDEPAIEDLDHVYEELTTPRAPFAVDPFPPEDPRPRALAIIGDGPHEPGHLEKGLRPAFEAAGAAVRFAVDPQALSAESLMQVQLLVILRDGYIWPEGRERPAQVWMTPDQENAVVDFVEKGGGLLALHNATGLYREEGLYLNLLGGVYRGHGPLERFRVKVVDGEHPVTRGVAEYEVADEQHTPATDPKKVRILLESYAAEGVRAAAGWAREAGKGRVCYLANGHTLEALLQPEYQRLLRNAVRWCLKSG